MTGNCCQITSSLLCWKDPVKSGLVYGLSNLLLLSLWFEIPLFTMFVTWGGMVAILAGAVCKFGKLCDVETLALDKIVSKEQLEKAVGQGYNLVDSMASKAMPIIFWEDAVVSAVAIVGLYLATSILEFISLAMLCFLVLNVAFIYGKFQDQIRPLAAPHMKKAEAEFLKLWEKVPRYELPAALSGLATPKKGRTSEKEAEKKEE